MPFTLGMLFSVIKIYPLPGREHSIIEVLDSIKGPITALSDCLGCRVLVETGEDDAICYIEQWRTREALDRHLRSTLYGRVLEAMECSRLPPEVEFFDAVSIGGLELMKAARS